MTPAELFHEARLLEAVAAQRAVVATRPDDVSERLLLCALLGFTGDREKLGRHLDHLDSAPAEIREYLNEWRELLAADDARHRGKRPGFLIDPPSHIPARLRAADSLAAAREDEAVDLLDAADESAAWVEGYVDGRPFEGWRDADDLLAPVLEAFHGNRYVWVPIEQVRRLRLKEVHGLRDELYRPATVGLTDGSSWEVFLPAVYTLTAGHPEEGIRTGAGVDWVDRGGVMRGLGARTYLFGEAELTPAEFRQVEVRPG